MMLFSQVALTTDQQAAIGCVAVEAAKLEHFVEHALWCSLNLPPDAGKILSKGRAASMHLEWLRAAVAARTGDAERIGDLVAHASDALKKRNTLVHGVMFAQVPVRPLTIDDWLSYEDVASFDDGPPELRVRNRHADESDKGLAVADALQVAEDLSRARIALHGYLLTAEILPRIRAAGQ